MEIVKKIGIALALLLSSATAFAAFNCLTINRIDGKQDHFAIDWTTSINVVDEGVCLKGKAVTVIYPTNEVDYYTFEYFTFPSGVKYDGDKEDVSSLPETISGGEPISFSADSGVLSVRGAQPGSDLRLIGVNGVEVDSTVAASDGSAKLKAPVGHVYLLSVNGVTIKVIL